MADALEGPGHHLDPSIMIAVAWGSFSPPQLDASTAIEAHQRARRRQEHRRGRNRGTPPLVGHPRVNPVHKDRA